MKSQIRQRSNVKLSPVFFLTGASSSFLFLGLACLILIFGLFQPQAFSSLRTATTDFISPLISGVARPFQNMAAAVGDVSSVAELKAENKRLAAENERLREWYQTALMLEAENKSLQQMLNLKIDTNYTYATARVLSDASNAYLKTLLVASGEQEGILLDQAVLSGEGMIGRIIETGQKTARILLITDVNSRIPVLIEGSQQKAILTGNNSSFPILKYVPEDSSLPIGARVITSGDGGVFPVGFPIGRLHKTPKGNIVVKPFTDLNNVTYVRVVRSSIGVQNLTDNLSSPLSSALE